MTVKVGSPRVLDLLGMADPRGKVTLTREARRWIEDIYRRTGGERDKVVKTVGLGSALVWRADTAGVFPAGNPSVALLVTFNTDGVEVATITITGTLDSSLGTVSLASSLPTGETVSVALFGDGTDSARADVTHVQSTIVGSASFSAIDTSVSGSTPGIILSGGGGGGGGGSK